MLWLRLLLGMSGLGTTSNDMQRGQFYCVRARVSSPLHHAVLVCVRAILRPPGNVHVGSTFATQLV